MTSLTTTGVTREDAPTRRPVTGRLLALARAVEGTRRTSRFDVRRMLLAAGATCMALGMVAIVLGWYGAAHSSYLFQEVPYLISGGLLGVALVAGGGFLFFGSWLVRMIEDNHRYASRVEQTLARVDHVLGAITTDAAAASREEVERENERTRIGGTTSSQTAFGGHDGTNTWNLTHGNTQ